MKLVIGGAYSGKCTYVQKEYGITKEEIIPYYASWKELKTARCINGMQLLVQSLLEEGEDPIAKIKELIESNPDVICISDEIGNGIIPIDKKERIWREEVGRVNCLLAQHAVSVVRIQCGLPMILKG